MSPAHEGKKSKGHSKQHREAADGARRRKRVVGTTSRVEQEEGEPVVAWDGGIDLSTFAESLVNLFKAAKKEGLVEDLRTVDFPSIEPSHVVAIYESTSQAEAEGKTPTPAAKLGYALQQFKFRRTTSETVYEGFDLRKIDQLQPEQLAAVNDALKSLFFAVHAISPSVNALYQNVSSFFESTLGMDSRVLQEKFMAATQCKPDPVNEGMVDTAKGSLSSVLEELPQQLKGSSTFSELAERIGSRIAEIRPEIILDAKQDMDERKFVERAEEEHEDSAALLSSLFPDLQKMKMPKFSAEDIEKAMDSLPDALQELGQSSGTSGTPSENKGKGKEKARAAKQPKGLGDVLQLLGSNSEGLQKIVEEVGGELRGKIARKELSPEALRQDLQGVMSFLGQAGLGGQPDKKKKRKSKKEDK